MLKNYIKVAFRNIKKNKVFSLINLMGLALGMCCGFLIFLYVQHELSYDRFHEKAERIYRVVTEWNVEGKTQIHQTTAAPIAPALLKDYSEVQSAVRIRRASSVVSCGEKSFIEGGIYLVDPSFLELFNFPLIKGNPETALKDRNSTVITEEIAKKYFGDQDPIGKRLTIWRKHDFKITAVARNVPGNTHLRFNFLVRFDLVNSLSNYNYLGSWNAWNFFTYILLNKNCSAAEFEEKSPDFIKKYRGINPTNPRKLHLLSLVKINLETYGKLKYIHLFTAIAIVILLLACVNFLNLSVARSSIRVKEIGMRKVIGAGRTQIVKQFMGECLLLAIFALPVALFLAHLLLPSLNNLLMTSIRSNYLQNLSFISGILGIAVLAALLSGSYPSLYLSGLQPVQALRGEFRSNRRTIGLRHFLVTFQFIITVVLIVSTLTIHNQMGFIQKKNLGFNKDFVVNVPSLTEDLKEKDEYIKSELYKNSGINKVTVSTFSPGSFPNQSVTWEGKKDNEELMMAWYAVDHDFIKTFEIEILEGRDFSRDFPSDNRAAYILNEAALKALGWKNPLGKTFRIDKAGLTQGRIVGIMKDFHFASLYADIKPLALILDPRMGSTYSIKISKKNVRETLSFIEKTFKEFAPHMPFRYSFMDDEITEMYIADDRLGKMLDSFSMIALFLACMGLLGLASFSTIRRTREIGIRKILGASVPGIILQLSKEFTKGVVAANIIAWPLAYFMMNKWLQNFAYRASLGIWVFIFSALIVLLTALITVSYQAVRAAIADPVESLRYE